MTLHKASQSYKQKLIWQPLRLNSPALQNRLLQWGVIIAVGAGLGLYAIVSSSLSLQWAAISLVVILFPFGVMIVGNVRRLLLAAIIMDIPFQMDSYISFRDQAANFGAIGGLIVSITTISLATLYVLWLIELLSGISKLNINRLLWATFPLALYVFFAAFSILAATDIELSLFGIFLFTQMFLLYVYIVNTVQTREDIIFIVTIILVGVILESLVMIAVRIVGHSIDIGVMKARIDDTRVGGTVGGPNGAAGYLSLLLALAVSLLFTRLGQFYKIIGTVAFGLGAIALLLTLSRGGWVAFGLSTMLLCAFAWYRNWLSPAVPVAVSIVTIALAFFFQDTLAARIFGDDAGSAESRIPLMTIAFNMIADNFVFGVGINNFTVAMLRYAKLEITGIWLYTVHNNYLLIWAETGTIGLIAFLWFLSTSLWRGWQCWKYKDRLLSPLAFALAVGILGHMTHMHFDFFNSRPALQNLWLNAGLITAINILLRQEAKQIKNIDHYNAKSKPVPFTN